MNIKKINVFYQAFMIRLKALWVSLLACLKRFFKNKKRLIISASIISIVVLVCMVWLLIPDSKPSHQNTLTPNHQALMMQQQAHDVQETQKLALLKNIKNSLKSLSSTSDQSQKNTHMLQQLSTQLGVLIQSDTKAQQSADSKIDNLNVGQQQLAKQNHQVSTALASIKKAVTPNHYLSPHVLPFDVEGLSFWNGQPMVTISMNVAGGGHAYKLIGEGGQYGCAKGCMLWTVKHININAGFVIFKNHKGQMVKVSV